MYCSNCGADIPDNARFCTACGTTRDGTGSTAAASRDERIGKVIEDKYRIDSRIGAGGMATVYKGTRLLIGDAVAIKILHPEQLRDDQAVERFRREAQAAARLKHPNAVAIYDFGVSADGMVYLVMELVEGQSLRRLMRERGPLSSQAAAEIIAQVCAALDEAHRQQVVHRDLKPDNIVVSAGADAVRVKVLDFGIARLRDLSALGSLTVTGSVLGTPHYMSPEQCLGEELDHRSDVYSLGVVLYEMLAGVVPFNSPTSTAIVVQHVSGTPAPLRVLNVSIPPAVEAVVMRALAKRRDERPQTAGALAQELASAAASPTGAFAAATPGTGSGSFVAPATSGFQPTIQMATTPQAVPVGVPAPVQPTAMPARTVRRSWMAAAAAVAVSLVIGWGLVWMVNRPEETPAQEAGLSVRTEADSTVLVDGEVLGTTNAEGFLTLPRLMPGSHVVTVRKAGYDEQQRTISLTAERAELLEMRLSASLPTPSAPEPSPEPVPVEARAAAPAPSRAPVPPPPPPPPSEASLVVYTAPGSTILVDGQQAGTTADGGYLNVPGLRPGRHLVAIAKPGYRNEERTVTLAAGRNEIMRLELVSLPGRLTVIAAPDDAEILIGSRRYTGRVQGLELREGVYPLRVSKGGYVSVSRDVEVRPGELEELTVGLERVSAADLLADAERRLKARDFNQAAAISRSVLATDTANATANLVLGQALYNTGAYADGARYLKAAVSLGEEVVLQVAHHHGGLSESVCLGHVSVAKNSLSFQSNTDASHSFSVQSSHINEIKNEPQKAKRVNVNLDIQEGGRVAKRDYNFHHPAAKGFPITPGNPQSWLRVQCPNCDDRMFVLYSLLQDMRR